MLKTPSPKAMADKHSVQCEASEANSSNRIFFVLFYSYISCPAGTCKRCTCIFASKGAIQIEGCKKISNLFGYHTWIFQACKIVPFGSFFFSQPLISILVDEAGISCAKIHAKLGNLKQVWSYVFDQMPGE